MALTDKLTAIADAIRSKTGKTDGMTLDQMPGEIEGIEAGGGSGGGELDALFNKTITEVSTKATAIPANAFQDCKQLVSADCPSATSIGNNAFNTCSALTAVNISKATSLGTSAFQMCSKLSTLVYSQEITSLGNQAFYNCQAIANNLCFPLVTALGQRVFQMCYKVPSIDLPKVTSIAAYAFYDCRFLTAVILRSETMCTLSATTAFSNAYHFTGQTAPQNPDGLKDGYIYVPSALVEDYKVATNWSTYATQFRALEDYTIDGTITGELDPSKI